jgi:hypothetical protein
MGSRPTFGRRATIASTPCLQAAETAFHAFMSRQNNSLASSNKFTESGCVITPGGLFAWLRNFPSAPGAAESGLYNEWCYRCVIVFIVRRGVQEV